MVPRTYKSADADPMFTLKCGQQGLTFLFSNLLKREHLCYLEKKDKLPSNHTQLLLLECQESFRYHTFHTSLPTRCHVNMLPCQHFATSSQPIYLTLNGRTQKTLIQIILSDQDQCNRCQIQNTEAVCKVDLYTLNSRT